MRLFVHSAACTSEVHCGDCRDREHGREKRRWWAKRFTMPPGGEDFACPKERGAKPWGYKPAARKIPPPAAIPRSKWPAHIAAVAKFASPEDTGVGDTIERLAGGAGKLFAAMFKALTGQDCGCGGRKDALNTRYSYPNPP